MVFLRCDQTFVKKNVELVAFFNILRFFMCLFYANGPKNVQKNQLVSLFSLRKAKINGSTLYTLLIYI